MRTNIDIDDKLMADAMAAGGFKTKREAVEAGLKLIKRREAYAAIRAARGTLFWDDSDEAWAQYRATLGKEASVSASQAAPAIDAKPAQRLRRKVTRGSAA
jgi:antitoxin ParD1/3/4